MCSTDKDSNPHESKRDSRPGKQSKRKGAVSTKQVATARGDKGPAETCGILQRLDEGTLLEVLLRLQLIDVCRSAISCKTFAKIARSEWLWQQLCARNGIQAADGAHSQGWRAMYTSMRHVRAINWDPQPMASLARLADTPSSDHINGGGRCLHLHLFPVRFQSWYLCSVHLTSPSSIFN